MLFTNSKNKIPALKTNVIQIPALKTNVIQIPALKTNIIQRPALKTNNSVVSIPAIKQPEVEKHSASIYKNRDFNWVHYLILNSNDFILNQRRIKSAPADLTSSWSMTDKEMNTAPKGRYQIVSGLNTIKTPQQILEHWTIHGIKKRAIIPDNEIVQYLCIYQELKGQLNIDEFLDDKFENAIEPTFLEKDNILFHSYPNLFHKYLLHLRNPYDNFLYIATQSKAIKKTNICAIHCYNLNKFVLYFGEYIAQINEYFDILVTYCIDNENVRKKYNYTFISMQNRGMDIGGKFIAVDYLKESKINYEYIFFIHSKLDNTRRQACILPFISNMLSVCNFIKYNKSIGGFFPPTLQFARYDLTKTTKRLKHIVDGNLEKEIGWDVNKMYINEMYNYLGIKDDTYIFTEGNYYILHKDVAESIFGDKFIYNILNTTTSFDYNWVNQYYKVNDVYKNVYIQYKKNKWFGNNMDSQYGQNNGLADGMLEHIYERIIIPNILRQNRTIKILNGNSFIENIESYLNQRRIESAPADLTSSRSMTDKEMNTAPEGQFQIFSGLNNSSTTKTKKNDMEIIKTGLNSADDFDWEIYLLLNPDLVAKGINTKSAACKDWHLSGRRTGRLCSDPDFDWEMYLYLYKDLGNAGINTKQKAYTHWINAGKREKRKPFDPDFDWNLYLLLYPDLVSNGIVTKLQAYSHWIHYGKKEGRISKINWEDHTDFDWEFYAYANKDLSERGIIKKEHLFMHWIHSGKKEGRTASISNYEKQYNNILSHKNYSKEFIHLNIVSKVNSKNDNYVVLASTESIRYGKPNFKKLEKLVEWKIDSSVILVIDFPNLGGGASWFLKSIVQMYKHVQSFLICRCFDNHIYFYINDDFMVNDKYTIQNAIAMLKQNKKKIKKVFVNSVIGHETSFLEEIFNLGKKVTSITHDYSLVFNNWSGFYHEFINKPESSLINVNKFHQIITQNEENLHIYKRFINYDKPVIVSELPDYKYSLHKVETNNKKTVIGILGNISNIKGFLIVYKLINAFRKSETIDIVIFGSINMDYEKQYSYKNIEELNKLLIEHKPNMFIECTLSPETYSYTLTLMMLTQLPILYQAKPFPSVVEDRLSKYKNKYAFENINNLIENVGFITTKKQDFFYTIDSRIYSNTFWDSYFGKEQSLESTPETIIQKIYR